MAFDSVGLTNIFLACITVVNLVILLIVYRIQKKD